MTTTDKINANANAILKMQKANGITPAEFAVTVILMMVKLAKVASQNTGRTPEDHLREMADDAISLLPDMAFKPEH